MILRFVSGAAAPERGAVLAELRRLEVPAEEIEGAVRLGAELDPEEALRLAAMPGVLSIEAAPTGSPARSGSVRRSRPRTARTSASCTSRPAHGRTGIDIPADSSCSA